LRVVKHVHQTLPAHLLVQDHKDRTKT